MILVPLTKKSETDYENDVSLEYKGNLEEFSFSEEEEMFLFDNLYSLLNEHLDLMIDVSEDEKIPFEKLDGAIRIVNKVSSEAKDKIAKSVYQKVLYALQKAQEYGTCIWIEM